MGTYTFNWYVDFRITARPRAQGIPWPSDCRASEAHTAYDDHVWLIDHQDGGELSLRKPICDRSANSCLFFLSQHRPHTGDEVYVTGTFDNWSKSEKLEKVGDGFQKTVKLPDSEKIYYKVGGAFYFVTARSIVLESPALDSVSVLRTPVGVLLEAHRRNTRRDEEQAAVVVVVAALRMRHGPQRRNVTE